MDRFLRRCGGVRPARAFATAAVAVVVASCCCPPADDDADSTTCTTQCTTQCYNFLCIYDIPVPYIMPNDCVNLPTVDLAYFGGHRRYILPPLSPSQPVIAGGEFFFPDRSLRRLFCCPVFAFFSFFLFF